LKNNEQNKAPSTPTTARTTQSDVDPSNKLINLSTLPSSTTITATTATTATTTTAIGDNSMRCTLRRGRPNTPKTGLSMEYRIRKSSVPNTPETTKVSNFHSNKNNYTISNDDMTSFSGYHHHHRHHHHHHRNQIGSSSSSATAATRPFLENLDNLILASKTKKSPRNVAQLTTTTTTKKGAIVLNKKSGIVPMTAPLNEQDLFKNQKNIKKTSTTSLKSTNGGDGDLNESLNPLNEAIIDEDDIESLNSSSPPTPSKEEEENINNQQIEGTEENNPIESLEEKSMNELSTSMRKLRSQKNNINLIHRDLIGKKPAVIHTPPVKLKKNEISPQTNTIINSSLSTFKGTSKTNNNNVTTRSETNETEPLNKNIDHLVMNNNKQPPSSPFQAFPYSILDENAPKDEENNGEDGNESTVEMLPLFNSDKAADVSSSLHRQSLFNLSRKKQVTKQITEFEKQRNSKQSPLRFKNSPLKNLRSKVKNETIPTNLTG
jgi:hypothetical protein